MATIYDGRATFKAFPSVIQTDIVSNVETPVIFDSEVWDIQGLYDTVLSRWTPPAGVVVYMSCQARFNALTVNSLCTMRIRKNGVTFRNNSDSVVIAQHQQRVEATDIPNGTDFYDVTIQAIAPANYSQNNGGTPGIAEFFGMQI